MAEENLHCYNFKQFIYPSGLLDKGIDATYIVHLEGNGRLSDVHKQLKLYQPSKIVYILFNKGYKNCTKKLPIQEPKYDLTDSFLQIFKHSNKNNYNNILILEDDFIFNEKIKEKKHCNNITNFLNKNTNVPIIYYLGCIPFIQLPLFDRYHNKIILSGGTHSVIYNKLCRSQILLKDISKIDWDIFLNMYSNVIRIAYYIPLCYQLFPETENNKTWGKENIFLYMLIQIIKYSYKLLNLDTVCEPGYSIFYAFSKIIPIILVFIILYVLIKILNIKKRIKK